jgi:hypothetical protein
MLFYVLAATIKVDQCGFVLLPIRRIEACCIPVHDPPVTLSRIIIFPACKSPRVNMISWPRLECTTSCRVAYILLCSSRVG